jgi:hypothetical protein
VRISLCRDSEEARVGEGDDKRCARALLPQRAQRNTTWAMCMQRLVCAAHSQSMPVNALTMYVVGRESRKERMYFSTILVN